jgi:putative serine protease PepD
MAVGCSLPSLARGLQVRRGRAGAQALTKDVRFMTAGYDPTGNQPRPGPLPPAAPFAGPPYPPPVQPPAPPQPPATYPHPVSAPAASWSAPPLVPAPLGHPAPAPFGVPPRPRRRVVLALLVVVLFLVAGGEGYLLYRQNGRLDDANRRAAADRVAASKRADTLDGRIKALEQRMAGSLDSTAVANAVLPSVFRVDAGQFTGTAFAVGRAPSGGGTDLVTNYHVIQSIYEKGTRDAALERDSQRFPVKITQVDQKDDLALLHSTETFRRLVSASAQVQSGAPIVVVGAPLGLAQTVTTGVVSAVRNDFPGEGGKTFIQFDAPINPGNSGGPVVNVQQQVVGIASAKATNAEGIGLAIPIALACQAFSIC